MASPYVIDEVLRNLDKLPLPPGPASAKIVTADDILTLDRPAVFPASKDRPVLFTAAAWANVLLTLDRQDLAHTLGRSFYAITIQSPGEFLESERAAGRLAVNWESVL